MSAKQDFETWIEALDEAYDAYLQTCIDNTVTPNSLEAIFHAARMASMEPAQYLKMKRGLKEA